MTTLASALILRARTLCADLDVVRWTDAEFLAGLNEAEREIVSIRPRAYMKTASIPLVAGTKQSLPADGITFSEYVRYMGTDGATPGLTATKVSRFLLDTRKPGWHSVTATAVPEHFVYDEDSPAQFYVYPPNTGAGDAEVIYAAIPPALTATSSPINLPDLYTTPIVDFMVSRAFIKDSESAFNAERSAYHRRMFDAFFGLKERSDAQVVPKSAAG